MQSVAQFPISLPNVEEDKSNSTPPGKWHRMLVALRGASDKAGDSALRILAQAHLEVQHIAVVGERKFTSQ